MADNAAPGGARRIGVVGAILTVIGILTSGPLAIPVIALVRAQPLWVSPAVFVENFHRVQTLPYYFGCILLAGSILMLVAVCLLTKRRAAALVGLVFASIGAALIFFNYVVQTTFLPALVNNYTVEMDPVISAFSMVNVISIAWAIEMWGYGFIGLGTWLAAGFFGTSRLERTGKTLFILNGVVSILGALASSIDLSGVFSLVGLIGYGAWNLLYLALAVVFYRVLQTRYDEGRID